jgi:prepilin-type N-terminal cleavage/methylation domain-containing protein
MKRLPRRYTPRNDVGGFTLIELMVAIVISALVIGGGAIAINTFLSRQKGTAVGNEILSSLRLANSFARARQAPPGYAGAGLQYVEVTLNSGYLVAGINGIGTTYFAKKVTMAEVVTTMNPATIYFWGGDGRMASDIGGTPFASDQVATVRVTDQGVTNGYREIEVNSMGASEINDYVDEP